MTRVPDHKPKGPPDLGPDRPETPRSPRETGEQRSLIDRLLAHKHGTMIIWGILLFWIFFAAFFRVAYLFKMAG